MNRRHTNESGKSAVLSATATLQRRTMAVFTTNVAVLGIGYVASVVLARYLGPDGRGLLAIIVTAAGVTAGIAGMGTQHAAIYYAGRRAHRRGRVLGNCLAVSGVLLVTSLLVSALLMTELREWIAPAYDERIWLLAALLVPIMYLDVLVANLLSAQAAFKRRNRLSLAGRLATLVGAVVIVGWLGWGTAGALIATAPTLVVPIIGGLALLRHNQISLSKPVLRALLGYGARMQIGSTLHFLNARFDVLLLSAFAPLGVVGTYAIAQIVAELVLIFPNAFGYVLRAQVAASSESEKSLVGPAIRLSGSLVALCIAGVALVGPFLILFGFGSSYRPSIAPFVILLPGIWFLSMGGMVQDALSGRARPGIASILAVAEVAVTVSLDFLLIPLYGAVGGAFASVCAYTFYGCASIATLARLDGVRMHTLLFASREELTGFVRDLRARHA